MALIFCSQVAIRVIALFRLVFRAFPIAALSESLVESLLRLFWMPRQLFVSCPGMPSAVISLFVMPATLETCPCPSTASL